jgi:ribonuclease HII
MVMDKKKWLIGIDEAGRGPLAGPVAVGLVRVPVDFDWRLLEGVGDSKKVSPENREAIFRRALTLKKEGRLDFKVIQKSASEIDTRGVAVVIREAIAEGLAVLAPRPEECLVKLDGALRAPQSFTQETIIKGDQKELVIGLASIMAKVTRDKYMCTISKKYPQYDFATHKGYGTASHRKLIIAHGLSPIHRESYCQKRGTWSKV